VGCRAGVDVVMGINSSIAPVGNRTSFVQLIHCQYHGFVYCLFGYFRILYQLQKLCGLDDRGSRVRFPGRLGIFLFTTASSTALGPNQPPIQWVPGAVSLGVKLTTHLHLVPRSKNEWSYTSTPQYTFMAWCSVKVQGQLYLCL
jgi:hypothetical protein